VQDTDKDGIISQDELMNAMTLLQGDRSDAETEAVKKLFAGRETITLKRLEQYGLQHGLACEGV
jgi:Ca2+-binding EF-hand superfamily protein